MKKAIKLICGIIAACIGTEVFLFWLGSEGGSLLTLSGCLVLWSGSMWCFTDEKRKEDAR